MNKINILMPSCKEPLETSNFILGGRLLEYLMKTENHSSDAFFSFDSFNGTTDIYVRRETSEEKPNECMFFMFSNDTFCDNIKNTFFIKDSTVENLGLLVKEMYCIIEDNAKKII